MADNNKVMIYGKPVDLSLNTNVSAGNTSLPGDYARIDQEKRSGVDLQDENAMYNTMQQNQPYTEQIGRAGTNFLVQGIGMGAMMFGANDPTQLANAISDTERPYSNAIMDWSKQFMDENQKPVYQKDKETTFGSLTDPSWWLNRFSELGSTAGIAVETMGETAIVSALTGGLGTEGMLVNAAKKVASIEKAASMSMHIAAAKRIASTGTFMFGGLKEALTESNDTYMTVYKDQLEKGVSDEQAKIAAARGAALVFKGNAIYKMITGALEAQALTYSPIKGLYEGGGFVDKALERIPNHLLRHATALGLNAASEGSEEGIQYILQEEGKHLADRMSGFGDDSQFGDRMNHYIKQTEFINSVFVGALGGVVGGVLEHEGLKKILGRDQNPFESLHEEVSKMANGVTLNKINEIGMAIHDGNIILANALRRDMSNESALSKLHLDSIADKGTALYDDHVKFLKDTLASAEREDYDALKNMGIHKDDETSKNSIENIKNLFPKLIADAERIKTIYGEEAERNNGNLRIVAPIVQRRLDLENTEKDLVQTKADIVKYKAENPDIILEPGDPAIIFKTLDEKLIGLLYRKYILDAVYEGGLMADDEAKHNKEQAAEVDKEIEELKQQRKDAIDNLSGDEAHAVNRKLDAFPNDPSLDKLQITQEALIAKKEQLIREIADWRNKDFQRKKMEQYHKNVVKQAKTVKEAEEVGKGKSKNVEKAVKEKTDELNKPAKVETSKSNKPAKKNSPVATFDATTNKEKVANTEKLAVVAKNLTSVQDSYIHSDKNVVRVARKVFAKEELTGPEKNFYKNNRQFVDRGVRILRDAGTTSVDTPIEDIQFSMRVLEKDEDGNDYASTEHKQIAENAIRQFIDENRLGKAREFDQNFVDVMKERFNADAVKNMFYASVLGWNEYAGKRSTIDKSFKTLSLDEAVTLFNDNFSNKIDIEKDLTGVEEDMEAAKASTPIVPINMPNDAGVKYVNDKGYSQTLPGSLIARVVNFSTNNPIFNAATRTLTSFWKSVNSITNSKEIDAVALDNFEIYKKGKELVARVPENFMDIRATVHWSEKLTNDSELLATNMVIKGIKVGNKIISIKDQPLLFKHLVEGVQVEVIAAKAEGGKFKRSHNDDRQIITLHFPEGSEEYWNNIPIKIHDDQKNWNAAVGEDVEISKDVNTAVGFMHTVSWHHPIRYNNTKVTEDDIESAKKQVSDVRNMFKNSKEELHNKSVKLVITDSTNGNFDAAPNIEPTLVMHVSPLIGTEGNTLMAIKSSKGDLILPNGNFEKLSLSRITNIDAFRKLGKPGNGMVLLLYPHGVNEKNEQLYHVSNVMGVGPSENGIKSVGILSDLRKKTVEGNFEDGTDYDKIITSIRQAIIKCVDPNNREVINGHSMEKIGDLYEYIKSFVQIRQGGRWGKDQVSREGVLLNKAEDFYYTGLSQKSQEENATKKEGEKSKEGQIGIKMPNGTYYYISKGTRLNTGLIKALDHLCENILSNMKLERNIESFRNNLPVEFIDNEGKKYVGHENYVKYLATKLSTTTAEFNVGSKENPLYTPFLQRSIQFRAKDQLEQSVDDAVKEAIEDKKEQVEEQLKKEIEEPFHVIKGMSDDNVAFIKKAISDISRLLNKDSRNVHDISDIIRDQDVQFSMSIEDDITAELSRELRDSSNSIEKLTPSEQGELTHSLYNLVAKDLSDAEESMSRNKVDEIIKDHLSKIIDGVAGIVEDNRLKLEALVEEYPEVQPLLEDYNTLVDKMDAVTEHDNVIVADVKEQLKSKNFIKKEDESFDVDPENLNAKQTASFNIRKLMSATYDLEKDGSFKDGFLGTQKFLGADEVFDRVSSLLADKPASFDTFIKILKAARGPYPWLYSEKNYDLVSRLEKLQKEDHKTANEFTSLMSKHQLTMKSPLYSVNKNGIRFNMADTNSHTNTRKMVKDWIDNLKGTVDEEGLVKEVKELDYYVFNPEKVKVVYDNLVALQNLARSPLEFAKVDVRKLKEVMDSTGILLSEDLLDVWVNHGLTNKDGSRTQLIDAINSTDFVFDSLVREYKKILDADAVGKKVVLSEGKLVKNTVIVNAESVAYGKVMYEAAEENAKYVTARMVTSWRDGKKNVYGFMQHTFTTNRVNDLKNCIDEKGEFIGVARDINESYFNSNSQTLALLASSSDFRNRYKVSSLSKTAIKKLGAAVFGDKQISKLGGGDHELAKMIAFGDMVQSPIANSTVNIGNLPLKKRMASMFGLTMSDKSQLYVFDTAVYMFKNEHYNTTEIKNADYDEELYQQYGIGVSKTIAPKQEVLDLLYTHIVQAELTRISNHFGKEDINLKGYNPNFAYLIPRLNVAKLEDGRSLIELVRNSNGDLASIEKEIRPTIDKEMLELIKSLVDKKLKEWHELGIINEEGKLLHDNSYIKSMFGDATKDLQHQYAVHDYVLNYMLHNVDMYKLYGGDPAAYYKNSSVKGVDLKDYTNQNVFDVIRDTMVNVGKRLASQAAPGEGSANSDDNHYIQIFGKDKEIVEGKVYQEVLQKHGQVIADGFRNITATDAQEYMTWKEFLYMMEASGKLEDVLKDFTVSELVEAKKLRQTKNSELTERQKFLLKKVYQTVQKPVYTGQQYDTENRMMVPIYIKSSAFPLFEEFTGGMELDKLRKVMEHIEDVETEKGNNTTVRFSYDSANKVGGVKDSANIFAHDGTINVDGKGVDVDGKPTSDLYNNYDKHTRTLDRSSFRIQQPIPVKSAKHDYQDSITRGTQISKLLLSAGAINFKFNTPEGVKTGLQMYNDHIQIYKELVAHKLSELKKELMIDDDGNFFPETKIEAATKLAKILQDEAIENNYSKQDKESLALDNNGNFISPIWILSNSDKVEALLHSIISDRLTNVKMPGFSYVVGSEAGFQRQKDYKGHDKSRMVWINGPLTDEEGNPRSLAHDEVFLQPKFRGWDGKLINLLEDVVRNGNGEIVRDENGKPARYVQKITEKGGASHYKLNTQYIDEDLLNTISFRIPTSKHASISTDKIVGLLPPEAGDLMIVSAGKANQKGLDYDVDKENTYQYHTEIDSNGKIIKVTAKEDGSNNQEMILNKLVDMHKQIMSNEKVQKKTLEVLSTEDAMSQKAALEKITGKYDINDTPISDMYQKDKLLKGAVGKSAIGAFALDTILQPELEKLFADNKALQLMTIITDIDKDGKTVEKIVPYNITIGEFKAGKLGRIKTLDGARDIAEVVSEMLDTATDNEKLQFLGAVNFNNYTIPVVKMLNFLGFDKGTEVDGISSIKVLMMQQPVIKEYVRISNILDSNTGDYVAKENRDMHIITSIIKKYGIKEEDIINLPHGSKLTNEAFVDQIKKDVNGEKIDPLFQLKVLRTFITLKDYATAIQAVQTSTNKDSKGLGISYFDTIFDSQKIAKIDKKESSIKNIKHLVGRYSNENSEGAVNTAGMYITPETISSMFSVHALGMAKALWGRHFPYESLLISRTLFKLFGEDVDTDKARDVVDELKKFMYSDNSLKLSKTTAQAERERLAIDKVIDDKIIKESLASYIKRVRTDLNNVLLNALDFDINPGKNKLQYSTIKFTSTQDDAYSEEDYYKAHTELLRRKVDLPDFNGEKYDTTKLGKDLFRYAYLQGGVQKANEFVKYMSLTYAKAIGFTDGLRDMSDNMKTNDDKKKTDYQLKLADMFLDQLFRHNPEYGHKINKDALDKILAKGFQMRDSHIKLTTNLEKDRFYVRYFEKNEVTKKYDTHEYLYIRVSGSEYDYKRVSKLGDVGMTEYDANNSDYYSSNVTENEASFKDARNKLGSLTSTAKKTSLSSAKKNDNRTPVANLSMKVTIDALLKHNDVSKGNKFLLNLFNTDSIAKALSIVKLQNNPNLSTLGKHTKGLIEINNENLNIEKDPNKYATVLLHEIVHALTAYKINKYVTTRSGVLKPAKVFDASAPAYIHDLVKTFNDVKARLIEAGKGDLLKSMETKVLAAQRANSTEPTSLSHEEGLVYGIYDLHEFVAKVLTDPEFQRVLNGIKLKDRTLLDRFGDFITKILSSFGVSEFKSPSPILREAIQNSIRLITDDQLLESMKNAKDAEIESVKPAIQNKVAIKNVIDESNRVLNEAFSDNSKLKKGYEKVRVPFKDDEYRIINAKTIKFDRFPDHEFIIYNAFNTKEWLVSEKSTGRMISQVSSSTQKEAIIDAEKILNGVGIEKFKEAMSESDVLNKPIEKENKSNMKFDFQGYKGGFDNKGKGTPQGDGKDKAMREIADGFIGESSKQKGSDNIIPYSAAVKPSSTKTSAIEINKKSNNSIGVYRSDATVTQNTVISVTNRSKTDDNIYPKIIMLARNGDLANVKLSRDTKEQIKDMHNKGAEFVVGDMPNVDSQFIDYLQEIGATFTVYHTGNKSRIEVKQKDKVVFKKPTMPTNIADKAGKSFVDSANEFDNMFTGKSKDDGSDKKNILNFEMSVKNDLWKSNEEKLSSSYPTLTMEQFNSESADIQQKLIDCA